MRLIFIMCSLFLFGCAAHVVKKQDLPAPTVSTTNIGNNIGKLGDSLRGASDANQRLNENLTRAEILANRMDDKIILLQEYK